MALDDILHGDLDDDTRGVMWVVATRRGRVLRSAESESIARAASVVALAFAAASAPHVRRETTSTRRTIVADH